MSWKMTEEPWRDNKGRKLIFRIKNSDNGTEKICGITDDAINEYFETNMTPENTKINFEKHQNSIINNTVTLIKNSKPNDQGDYILNTKNFMK